MAVSLHITNKQAHILRVLIAGNGVDATGALIPVDLDELLVRIPYRTSKESMQFSIRHLINKGLMVKGPMAVRRDKSRITYYPTQAAIDMLGNENP